MTKPPSHNVVCIHLYYLSLWSLITDDFTLRPCMQIMFHMEFAIIDFEELIVCVWRMWWLRGLEIRLTKCKETPPKLGEITVWWLKYRPWNSKGALWSGQQSTVLCMQIVFFFSACGLYHKRSECYFIMRGMTLMWRLWTQYVMVQFWIDYLKCRLC